MNRLARLKSDFFTREFISGDEYYRQFCRVYIAKYISLSDILQPSASVKPAFEIIAHDVLCDIVARCGDIIVAAAKPHIYFKHAESVVARVVFYVKV